MDRAEAASGEKLLRDIMNENKIELYAAYVSPPPIDRSAFLRRVVPLSDREWSCCFASQGKVMNCGGGGSCGTCIVEVLPLHPNLQNRVFATEKWEWPLPTAAECLRIYRLLMERSS